MARTQLNLNIKTLINLRWVMGCSQMQVTHCFNKQHFQVCILKMDLSREFQLEWSDTDIKITMCVTVRMNQRAYN